MSENFQERLSLGTALAVMGDSHKTAFGVGEVGSMGLGVTQRDHNTMRILFREDQKITWDHIHPPLEV